MAKKKSGALVTEKLGWFILAAITIAVLFYIFLIQEEGGLQRLGRNVESLKKYLPIKDEIAATQTELPEEHLKAIKSLKNSIDAALLSGKAGNEGCFTEYGKLPDLGERGTSIEFRYENGRTMMFVYGGVEGRKIIPELTAEFENMIPCVIAGSDEVAENFFTKFIEKKEVSGNYFKSSDYVKIFYFEGVKDIGVVNFCGKGNRIMTIEPTDENEFYDSGPNRECNNLQDGGIFFSPDNRHICFIPTNYQTDADEHGIEDDYIGGDKSGSIKLGIFKEELEQC